MCRSKSPDALVRRTYLLPTRKAKPIHRSVRTKLIRRKPLVLMAVRAPIHTRAADMKSPARPTNVSTTCLASYLASGDVTSHKACRVVFRQRVVERALRDA